MYFSVWARYFVWSFKGTIWNCKQSRTHTRWFWNGLHYIDGLVQDSSISIANALEILESCTEPLICPHLHTDTGLFLPKCNKCIKWHVDNTLWNVVCFSPIDVNMLFGYSKANIKVWHQQPSMRSNDRWLLRARVNNAARFPTGFD